MTDHVGPRDMQGDGGLGLIGMRERAAIHGGALPGWPTTGRRIPRAASFPLSAGAA